MSSDWFQRQKEGITTPTQEKKETPDGLWHGCPKCKVIVSIDEYEGNLWVCGNCGYHNGIEAVDYFSFLFDGGKFLELDTNMTSIDPLVFEDTKKYKDRLEAAKEKTGLKDAITTGTGNLDNMPVSIAAMNFKFIGGSMGSVVGEKISRAIDFSLKNKIPFINENQTMKKALKIINLKRLGFLVATNTQGLTTGVFTDGDLKRLMRKSRKIDNLKIKNFMTKKPFVAEENTLASENLSQMNKKKITNVCIYSKKNKHKTIGVLHIHDLLNNLR